MPAEPTALAAAPADPGIRLAWLLVVNRLSHPDPSITSRSRFVEHLRSRGVAADVSRVSRWESGQQVPSARQLEVYEELLGLPRWSLITLQRAQARLARGRPGRAGPAMRLPTATYGPDGASRDPADELERLVAVATTPAGAASPPVGYLDWLRLADVMTGYDAVYLDRSAWTRLFRRLLCELTTTTGLAELGMYDATTTLNAHPVAGRHLREAIIAWLSDPAVQEPVGLMYLLARAPGGAGLELLSQLLGSSTSHPLYVAAEQVASDMLSREQDLGPLDPARGERLEQILSARVTERHSRVGLAALDLAVHLPPAAFARVKDRVTDPAMRVRLSTLAEERLLFPEAAARQVARSMARVARDAIRGPVDLVPDPLLERLITDALFGVSVTLRWQAGLILGLSPYARPLAESCLDLVTGRGAVLARTIWRAVYLLCDDDTAPRLVSTALAETRPEVIRDAVGALARLSQPLSAETVDELVRRFSAEGPDPARGAIIAALGRHAPRSAR